MKIRFLTATSVIGALSMMVYPLHVAATPTISITTPKEIPDYFYLTPHQLSNLLTKSIRETNNNLPIRNLRVHSRQYEENCDHVFFTFQSNDGLYVGIGELKESRVKEGQRPSLSSIHPMESSADLALKQVPVVCNQRINCVYPLQFEDQS